MLLTGCQGGNDKGVSKNPKKLGKSYVNGSQMGDMWTINNFHLGLKLCEATSHMAGQRE